MNNKAIYFIGGFIWALVSSRKTYAPNIIRGSKPSKVLERGGKYTKAQQDALYKRQMREYGLIKTKPEVSDNPNGFKAESQADCPKGYSYISKNNCVRVQDLFSTIIHKTSL